MSTVAVLDTGIIVTNRLLQEQQWPAMRFMAAACLVVAGFLAAGLTLMKSPGVTLHQCKWILLRGVCGNATVTLEILAIRAGMAAGDLSALTSINMVFSAILGRIFLGEVMWIAHAVALAMSLAGAVLMARPGPLAGTETTSGMSIMGFMLATASGFTTASLFICSRKSASVSPWHLSVSTAALGVPLFLLLSQSPWVDDFSLQPVVQHPKQAAAFLVLLSVLALLTILCVSIAAQWCPAMVSATVHTGSRMVGGYVAQVVLFGTVPDMISLTGAGLLFASVVIVAVARARETTRGSPKQDQDPESTQQDAVDKEADAQEEEDEESLAHFVASEFAEFEPHQQPLRHRCVTKTTQPGVQMFGAGLAGLAVAA